MKKAIRVISGTLMCPLSVGAPALIFRGGQYIQTSTAVSYTHLMCIRDSCGTLRETTRRIIWAWPG